MDHSFFFPAGWLINRRYRRLPHQNQTDPSIFPERTMLGTYERMATLMDNGGNDVQTTKNWE
jgi:hypothetical protein